MRAIETSEAVKVAIKREEEKIRQKTAEALALKAQWKNAQIQNAIHKALDGIGSIEDSTQAFGRAQEKIRNAQSEAGARADRPTPMSVAEANPVQSPYPTSHNRCSAQARVPAAPPTRTLPSVPLTPRVSR